MKTKVFFVYALIILFFYLSIFILKNDQAQWLTEEDGIIENLTALFYFCSSLLFFFLFYKYKIPINDTSHRNYFYLFLGLVLLVFCGEEISWGQRIFNWDTPSSIITLNRQSETNIHNLAVFHSFDENNHAKHGWTVWVTAERLYSIGWFTYALVIPFFYLINHKFKLFISKINFPIIPLSLGLLFLGNHLMAKLFENINHFQNNAPITELKEMNFAGLFLLVSIFHYRNLSKIDPGLNENQQVS